MPLRTSLNPFRFVEEGDREGGFFFFNALSTMTDISGRNTFRHNTTDAKNYIQPKTIAHPELKQTNKQQQQQTQHQQSSVACAKVEVAVLMSLKASVDVKQQ